MICSGYKSEQLVEKADAVDLSCESRSRCEHGLCEATVNDILAVFSIICREFSAVDSELGAIENLEFAGSELCSNFCDVGFGAFSSSCTVLAVFDRAGLKRAGPVSSNGFAVFNALDSVLDVGSPVDSGECNVGVGAGFSSGYVVGNVRNTGGLAGSRSTHGVCVLGDESAAGSDKGVCAFLFSSLVIPGTGEGNGHDSVGNYGTNAEEPGGVTGDNFSIGECADVTDLNIAVLIIVGIGELAGIDHFLELEAGCNACEVTAFVDGSKCIVEVGEVDDLSLIAGGVQEFNVFIFLCGADHIVFMTEAVCKNDIAAVICEVASGFIAILTFGNAGLENELNAHLCAGFLCGGNEIPVIGGVFIMERDKAELNSLFCGGSGESAKSNDHNNYEGESNELFHSFSPLIKIYRIGSADNMNMSFNRCEVNEK